MLAPVEATPLKSETEIVGSSAVRTYLDEARLVESDFRELRFWASAKDRNPLHLLLHKAPYMSILRRCEKLLLEPKPTHALELGAGYGWGSATLKCISPATYVVASDVSSDAMEHADVFEQALGAKMDEKWAASADNLPFADGTFDLVFCFSAFHHFIIGGRYRAALAEIVRVLRPGGRFVMIYEPATPEFWYSIARARVRLIRKKSGVDEDVIVIEQLREAALSVGASISVQHFPDVMGRHTLGRILYYAALAKLPWLQNVLPSTINAVISKPSP